MSGSTSELNLKTAVDADDTADYLTLSLADSLRTVDALFNNVTGHNHSGAHQGGPLGSGSIGTGAIADGAVTSAKIADGTIATADLADRSVTNIKLGTDTARANLLTNGGFEIWQRGTGPFTAHQAFTADRWQIQLSGGQTANVNRSTGNADAGSTYAVSFVISGTVSAGAPAQLLQINSSSDYSQLGGRTFTLSMRVKSTQANAVRLSLYDGVSNTNGAYHSGSGVYETLTVTMTFASNATVLYTRAFMETAGTFYVDNAMLVIGSVPADYAPLHPADDLARCLRYYEKFGGDTGNSMNVNMYHGAGQVLQMPLYYKAVKPVTPTITKVGTWTVNNCSQPGTSAQGLYSCMLYTTVTVTGAFSFQNDVLGDYLTIESNP
jgi:hypothetical protein